MSTEFLAADGAVEATGADTGVAAHYGNPMAEQRALAAGEAIVDLSHRGVVCVTGPDRLSWLDSVSSQSLAAMVPGASAETLLLGQTGRIEHDIRVIEDGESTWLLVEASQAESLARWLESMRFLLQVQVADRTADFATLGMFGRPLLPAAAPHGVPLVWHDPWRALVEGGYQYASASSHPSADWTYLEVVIARSKLAEAAKLPHAGTLALEALRVAAWRPRFATEVDEKTIPHELDILRSAVHLSKGCYRGQETVAKVHNLGHPPRRLVMLHLDGSDGVLPDHGDEVQFEGRAVGRVTTAARHFELGPVALAVVKRTTDPDAVLTIPVDGVVVTAAQELIVPPTAGSVAGVPRLPRLR